MGWVLMSLLDKNVPQYKNIDVDLSQGCLLGRSTYENKLPLQSIFVFPYKTTPSKQLKILGL